MIGGSFALLVICAIVALAVLGIGGFIVLLKLGVIVREASRPTYQDRGSYSLEQGREIRPEEEQPRRYSNERTD
jgi:hypothetical protein